MSWFLSFSHPNVGGGGAPLGSSHKGSCRLGVAFWGISCRRLPRNLTMPQLSSSYLSPPIRTPEVKCQQQLTNGAFHSPHKDVLPRIPGPSRAQYVDTRWGLPFNGFHMGPYIEWF